MRILLTLTLMFAVSACGSNTFDTIPPTIEPTATVLASATPAPTNTPVPTNTPTPTNTPAPTSTPTPTNTPQPQPLPTEQLADLAATSIAELPPTSTPEANGLSDYPGLSTIQVLPLTGPGSGLAVAFTSGFRRFDPEQYHYVAIYTRDEQNWRELGRVELNEPDYIDPASIQQVSITSDRVWLTVDSGVGAHGSCFNLLSFDQQEFTSILESCSSAPGAGSISDIDGDGITEVLLNGTDYYVTCYACGLRVFRTTALRWDENENAFKQLQLTELPGDTELAKVNNEVVTFAKANRWREARLPLPKLRSLAQGDPIVLTNASLIEIDGKSFADQAANTALAPLMPSIFYGDYEGTLAYLRGKPVADLFEVERSQIFGAEVQGFEANMPKYIITTVEPALVLDPTLAPARFLKGWAMLLANPKDPQGLAEIEQAAKLAPQEPLYTACVAYLKAKS